MLKPVEPGQLKKGDEIIAKPIGRNVNEHGKVLRELDLGVPGVWIEYRSEKTWMIRMTPISRVRVEKKRRRSLPDA